MKIRLIVALSSAVLLTGCTLLTGCHADEPRHTETRSYEVNDPDAALRVESGGGRIVVVAGTSATVKVTETLRYRGARPEPQHTSDGTELRLTSGCGDDCGVDYRVEVPAATAVRLDSGGGAVTVTALSGPLDVTSGGGQLDGMAGSAMFTARTGGGAVEVRFTAPPERVDVTSDGGSVTLRLPTERYAVSASADGGDTAIGVTRDDASPRRITVSSGGGDIRLSA
jgi:hypothetical protein